MKKTLTYYTCDLCGAVIGWDEDEIEFYCIPRYQNLIAKGGRGECHQIVISGPIIPVKTCYCDTCATAVATLLETQQLNVKRSKE